MRIGVAQINPVLGDCKTNREKILKAVEEAVEKRCSLIVFPECALLGYHPFDLLERASTVDDQLKELREIEKRIPTGVAVLLGALTKNPKSKGRPYFNSAALIVKGRKTRFFHKTLLPTGDVFDEARFIEAGDMSKNYFSWRGKKFFLTICEDIWAWPDENGKSPYQKNPVQEIDRGGVDLVINLSASPWHIGKLQKRRFVTGRTAAWMKAPLLYVNLVGAQDEIIFDGRSFLIDPKGKVLFENLAFEEQINVLDLETKEVWTPSEPLEETEELRRALVLGLRDFCEKIGFQKVHLGLSGGIDSALVACLAVDALGAAKVSAYAMPGPYSAGESFELAEKLAKNLRIGFHRLPIDPVFEAANKAFETATGSTGFGVVQENLQSRIRGMMMMAVANKEGSLLLTTGNKSEYATGYATLYGDMCGGLAPIGDLTKEQVYRLCELYNHEMELIPRRIIERPPTAELRPNQKDQDSLPPYPELDKAVVHLVAECRPPRGKVEKWLTTQILKTEFKRWQAPPILKVSAHSFGRGRRYPLAHRHREE